MQIKIANYNTNIQAGNITAQRGVGQFAKTNTGNMFGAQCKVTISHEGKKLSEQALKPQTPQSIQTTKVDRMLIRQQKQQESYQDEYSKTLESINSMIRSVQESNASAEDLDTIQKKQEALREMVALKEQQEEENKKRIEEAKSALAVASKQQAEIDRKNNDLLLMLESFSDEEEDEKNGSHSIKQSDEENSKEQGSIGEQLGQSATELGVSAARRELRTVGVIQELENDGLGLLSDVREIMRDINADLASAEEALQDSSISEEDRKQMAADYANRAMEKTSANYADMLRMKAKGLQEKRDAKELKTEHIVINPLNGVSKAQQVILDAAADAALREETQGMMDETSQELADKVQEEIDKRNHNSNDSEKDGDVENRLQEKLEQEKLEQEALEKEELEKEAADKNVSLENTLEE